MIMSLRGGFGLSGSNFRKIHYPSVENKFMDNPSVNRPLIGSGGRVVGFNGLASGIFLDFFWLASGL